MLDALLGMLAWFTQWSDPLAWLVVGTFSAGAVLDWSNRDERSQYSTVAVGVLGAVFWAVLVYYYAIVQGSITRGAVTVGAVLLALGVAGGFRSLTHGTREPKRLVTTAAWVLFGFFWFTLIYHFAFVQKSIVEGIGTLVAVPASLYVAYLLADGRDSLFALSRAIAVMGLVYVPFETLVLFKRPLVEIVTRQTEVLMNVIGYHPDVIYGNLVSEAGGTAASDYAPYRNTFEFYPDPDHRITYTILIACTGIGSMAIFAGLIAAVHAPLSRKLRALAVSIPIIYALNLVRNVFIGVSFGKQYLHVFPDTVMTLFGTSDPYMVSYYVADRIMAQVLSVAALVAITWLVVRELPEVLVIVEDVLYLLTGTEYDLREALGVQPVRADGE
ncbi:archaeosortase A [Halorientalis brevis]|uniref:Archaeosortase A n=1 Tax=Halorientalis brevis TaxID=1126241 RepID=A0ABD6CGU7_9EURY|nr:archaeosortase A [Halorientalis brevis]